MDNQETSLIYGKNAVTETLNSGREIDTVYVQKGASLGKIMALAKKSGAVVKEVSDERLTAMCGTSKHGGTAAELASASYSTVEDILAAAQEKGKPPFIIIADEIEDPHNLGAIIRTAECVGAHGVVIPKRRSAGLTAIVDKASAGAAEHMLIARVANLPAAIKTLKDNGLWIYGTAAGGQNGLWTTDFTGALALVIGSEGDGMGRLVAESCDFIVSLPMKGQVSSLNASAAAAITMYEILRQRMG